MKSVDDLESIISQDMTNAQGYIGDTVSSERAAALHYYEGEPFGNEMAGRSQVVSRDVLETVEWIMPALMRAFAGSDDVVEFIPQGPEDIAVADQATEYVNFIWSRDNDGFLNFYSWFKDALLLKNGYVKVWPDDVEKKTTHYLTGLSDEEFLVVAADDKTEVKEHTSYEEMTEAGPQVRHDLKICVTETEVRVRVECVPCEHFLIDKFATSLKKAKFLGHRELRTKSDLIEEGYDKEFVASLPGVSRSDSEIDNEVNYERHDESADTGMEGFGEEQNESVWVTEWYCRIDRDEDGIAEPLKILVAGDKSGVTILERNGSPEIEDWDGEPPFADLAPIIMPHRHLGVSIADLVMDIQRIKSAIWRQSLDGMYNTNSPVTYINTNAKVNYDDVLTRRPGGVIRGAAPPGEAIQSLYQPFDLSNALGMMNYADQVREIRTGIGEVSAGLDADILQNQTAMAANLANAAKNARVELIARLFAETGVKRVFKLIYKTVCEHQDRERVIRLNNEFVPVDPRNWNSEMDVEINVGLGTGNNDRKLAHLAAVMSVQEKAFTAGLPFVTMDNLYNTAFEMAKAAELNPDRLFTDPKNHPPQSQEKPDPEMQKAQAELALKAEESKQNAQVKMQEAQQKAQIERAKAAEAAKLQREKAQADIGMERERGAAVIQLEQEKARLAAELEREKAVNQMRLKEQELAAEIALEKYKVEHGLPGGQGNVPEVE